MQALIEGADKLGISLDDGQVAAFEAYYQLLVDGNQRANLTSVVDYDQVQTRHYVDSLTVASAIRVQLQGHEARRLHLAAQLACKQGVSFLFFFLSRYKKTKKHC